jgi:recombination protein RecA
MSKEKKEEKINRGSFSSKEEARKAALLQIAKDHGEGAAFEFASHPLPNVEAVHTGSLSLDVALGVGGYPRGRIIEIYGPEASGKTTLTLHAIAEMQKLGGSAAFIDAEHALDPVYARALGVNMDNLVLSQPDNGEQALDIAETMVASGGFDIVVIDSVAALVPKAELEGDMGDAHVGLQARLMSQALRKLTSIVSKSNTILVFINQTRMKIGVMYGSNETTTGGNSLKFYASVRLEIRRITTLKNGDTSVGNRTRVKVVKNKVAPPFREVEFDILFGKGVNYFGELVELGTQLGLIDRAGAWYSYQGERIGQGAEKTVAYLEAHPDLVATLDKAIRANYRIK